MMKKTVSIILVLALALSMLVFAGCGSKPAEEPEKPTEETSKPIEETSKPEEETGKPEEETGKPEEEPNEPEEEPNEPEEEPGKPEEEPEKPAEEPSKPAEKPSKPEAPVIGSAVDFFTKVWNNFGSDKQFPAAGGDEDNMAEGPAKFVLNENNAEMFKYLLHVTDELYDMFEDDAATLQHMMNTNTFSSAVVKLKDASKAAEFAETYKEVIQGQQWMCGFPDKVTVISVGDYVVIAYGKSENIDNLIAACTAVEAQSKVLVDAPALID